MKRAMIRMLLAVVFAVPTPGITTAQDLLDPPVRYGDDHLSAEFHRGRRAAVIARLPDDALAVFFGAPTRNRSNDIDFEYRQSSDFLYLTGSNEPGSALILAPEGVRVAGATVTEILFVPPRDPAQEVWLGRRFGAARAMRELGVALAVDATRFEEIVGPLLEDGSLQVFHLALADGVPTGSDLATQHRVFLERLEPLPMPGGMPGFFAHAIVGATNEEAWRRARALTARGFDVSALRDPTLRGLGEAFVAAGSFDGWITGREEALNGRPDGSTLRSTLDDLRVIKTEEELEVLRRSIEITVEAHREVMTQVEPGWAEYEIEALVEYTFKKNGAEYPGFPSIVGSAENSVILHYESNRRTTEPGDLVVIDVGAELHGYSADVTRTVPVDGRFSEEQRAIYALVYRAQEAGIDATRASNPVGATHQAAVAVLAEGLAELGLISGPSDARGLRRFFMHGTSHYLGLDVHDVGTGEPLEPGTVITVEPGIYIAPADDIDPRWWNIGVRIEDDVLVTDSDPVILSAGAPRHPDEVEALMQRRPVS